jgi:hypothetical protein
LGGVPTLIGEFGIAFDMNDKKAYRTGDFSAQIKAMDRSFRAMEDNLLSCTLWRGCAPLCPQDCRGTATHVV